MAANILAVGMVTALGLDWRTSCAASRAGIRRLTRLNEFPVQGIHAADRQFAIAHAADLLTRGFEKYGRLLRLLSGAMRDIKTQCPDNSAGSVADFCMTFPSLSQPATYGKLLDQAARISMWPGAIRLAYCSSSGPAGFGEALSAAMKQLDSGNASFVVAGAVDGLLDYEELVELHSSERLKKQGAATGLIPGEAAVLMLLGAARSSNCLGQIEAVVTGQDDRPWKDGGLSVGRGLAEVFENLEHQCGWPHHDDIPWVMSDQNGEANRAYEWGQVIPKLIRQNPRFSEVRLTLPVISFGDTRAAGSALGIGLAAAAWKRGYAAARSCAIITSSDGPLRAGLVVRGLLPATETYVQRTLSRNS